MSADRGQANSIVLVVLAVLVAAAFAAWFVVDLGNRDRVEVEQAATLGGEEQAAVTSGPAPGEGASEAGGGPAGGSDAAVASKPAAGSAKTLPRLLDLGSSTCVPCKMMAPILDEMKETFGGRLTVDFIDVRKDNAAARQYGVKVIPTQIFLAPDGTELFRHQGFFSREDILAKWKELGYEFTGRGVPRTR